MRTLLAHPPACNAPFYPGPPFHRHTQLGLLPQLAGLRQRHCLLHHVVLRQVVALNWARLQGWGRGLGFRGASANGWRHMGTLQTHKCAGMEGRGRGRGDGGSSGRSAVKRVAGHVNGRHAAAHDLTTTPHQVLLLRFLRPGGTRAGLVAHAGRRHVRGVVGNVGAVDGRIHSCGANLRTAHV
eukprot:363978-Chlamydomonas_euryale.AAC.4